MINGLRIFKIFLASSGELKEEREQIKLFIATENNRLIKQKIFLELLVWEDMPLSIRTERIQDYFNEQMLSCDAVFVLVFTKVGQFTKEEFELAHKNLKAGKKPRYLFVYFKRTSIDISKIDLDQLKTVRELEAKIKEDQGISNSYDSISTLKVHLKRQLDLLIDEIEKRKPSSEQSEVETSETDPSKYLDIYKQFALNEHRHLPMQGFETTLRVPIEIERIYVNMRANVGDNKDVSEVCGIFGGRRPHGYHAKRGEDDTDAKDCVNHAGQVDLKGAMECLKKLNVKDMIILGDPGSGKTTLLKYILITLIKGIGEEKLGLSSGLVPFFAPLRELKNPDKEDFESFIQNQCHLEDYSISRDFLSRLLNGRKGIVLLDGLDEVSNEDMRVRTCKWIDRARKRYVHTHFIITSRFAGYYGKSQLQGAVLELSIQDFTPKESKAFLERWFETVEEALHPSGELEFFKKRGREKAGKLAEEVQRSTHLKSLAVNPLLLQIIALIRFDRGTKLPERRVELYQECTDMLLAKWDMAKGLEVMLSAKEARSVLQPIALWLHTKEGRRSAFIEQIKPIVRECLDNIGKSELDPDMLLTNIRDRSGIFMGYSASEYGFTHLSFQEYLSAEQVRKTGKVDMLIENYGKTWWREVILLSLGLDNPSIIEEFMRKAVQEEFFTRDITLISDAVKNSIDKPFGPFIKVLTDDKHTYSSRVNSIRILVEMGGKKSIETLKTTIASKEKSLALVAYEALESLGAAKGIRKPVIEVSLSEKVINEKDNSEMLLIPAGTFIYGSREDDKDARSNEKPQQTIHVPEFYMDKYPVTNAQYKRFVDETGHRPPDNAEWGKPVWKGNHFPKELASHPVICVSWEDSMAYAKWAGKRLPSEIEWEKAARGTDGRKYPWGNDEISEERCNYDENYKGTTEVGKFGKKGESPYGCQDMSGNVDEWCREWYDSSNEKGKLESMFEGPATGSNRVIRGGCWDDDSRSCRAAYRSSFDPEFRLDNLGFRCASPRGHQEQAPSGAEKQSGAGSEPRTR